MSEAGPWVIRWIPRPLVVVVATLALFGLAAEPIAEATTSGSATLQASKPEVTFGGWVVFTGALVANDPCKSGREVRLRRVEAGSHQWTLVWTGTTKDDGTFQRGVRPDHTARYQAYLPLTPTCDAVASNWVSVPVAVRIAMSGPDHGIPAGSCGTVRAQVAPPKPGTKVAFQRLSGSTWKTVATATLSDSSRAFTQRCTTWPDIGTVRWRATWSAVAAHDPLNADGAGTALAVQVVEAYWMRHVDRLVGGRNTGIAVFQDGRPLYERADTTAHIPASNEKLLLSMALLDRVPDPGMTIATRAEAGSVSRGVVAGNLWLVGRGDPTVSKLRMQALAQAVVDAGVRRVTGSVKGSTSYFSHDWFAPGWKPDFPADEVALPTALTYRGNQVKGTHVSDPERRAAAAFTAMLQHRGVKVAGKPGAGAAPGGLGTVAGIASPPLRELLRRQNVDSVNFDAEVLGKLLGALASGAPGTIDKGADAIAAWAGVHGASVVSEDSSGLSYANRATPIGIVRLLHAADAASWGAVLRATLPTPGHGTLEDRLAGIPVVAKTGTLEDVSALSGWVRLSRTGEWATFSILSGGFSPSTAKDVEDAVVATLYRYAH